MNALPTLFISHGSPMHALHAGRAGAAWAELGRRLPKPKAIVMASAHWETEWPMLATQAKPETIHDFGGFPPELYKIRYAAPGAPDAAQRAVELLRAADLQVTTNGCRGLDHGAWVPLRHMYPAADIPVTQISLQPALGAEHHLRVGAALAPLTHEGVLVIGSGHMTHNLRDWMQFVRTRGRAPEEAGEADYVAQFRAWADSALAAGDADALARWHEVDRTLSARIRATSTTCRCRWRSPRPDRIRASSTSTPASMPACWRWTPTCSTRSEMGSRETGSGLVFCPLGAKDKT